MTGWHEIIAPPPGLIKEAQMDTGEIASSVAGAVLGAELGKRLAPRAPLPLSILISMVGGRAGSKAYLHAKKTRESRTQKQLQKISSAYRVELLKIAKQQGHWRKLKPGQEGEDEQGNPIRGKTWVNYGLREEIKLKKHQDSFYEQVSADPEAGHIAAHGTGTGKTVSAIAAFEKLKGEGKVNRALVVAPAGLRTNFAESVPKFSHSKAVIVSNANQEIPPDTNYVVVSYAAFRQNPAGFIKNYGVDAFFADEFHRAGNPDGQTYKAIAYARQHVPVVIGMTASIAQNEAADAIPLVNLVRRGPKQIEGKKEFRSRYTKRVPTGQRGVFGGEVNKRTLVRKEELYNKIGPHIHYIEDLNATEKPPKEVRDVSVPMSKDQVKLYRMAMKGVDPTIQRKIGLGMVLSKQETMNVFTRLMRARQVSNSMHLANKDMPLHVAAESTPKIRKILDDVQGHLEKTDDGKVVIYTNLVKGGVDVISAGLKNRGIEFGVFAGKSLKGMTEASRQQDVADYKAGKKKVIIITGAGAEGLSLGNTTMVALADGHYNPERMNQAMARGIRAGGQSHRPIEKRKVLVNRYVSAVPRSFWQKITLQDQKEKSVGQWVYATADRKARETRQMRDLLQRRHMHEEKQRNSRFYRWFGGGP